MTTTALTRTGTLLNAGPFRRGFLIGFFATLAAGIALLAAVSIAVAALTGNRVMPGTRVGGVELGGLDRAAAEARLRDSLPSAMTGDLTLSIDGTSIAVPYADLGRGYRMDEMLDRAFAVARSGNLVSDALARIRVLARPTSVPILLASQDPGVLDRTVGQLVARFDRPAVNASVAYDPDAGYTVTAAAVGARLDPDVLRSSLLEAASAPGSEAGSVSLSTTVFEPAVTTADADRAALEAQRMVAGPLALRAGGESHDLPAEALAGVVTFAEDASGRFGPVVDRVELASLIEPLSGEVARDPQNATFIWGADGISGVTPAVDGLQLDVWASVDSVSAALQSRARASVIRAAQLGVVATPAAVTTDAAKAAAAQMQRLGTWTTYYVPGDGNYWGANISIPAHDLDKLTLAPGEWFSFWDDIGPMTLERGYGYGGAIIGGRSVHNGAIGGGVCSTSTTLFNAAMRSGLEIGERTNHSYYIERYPKGLDATVFKTDTSETDMTFRNDTANPVVIRAYTGTGWVRFDIWGVPDGRTVSLSAPVTSNYGVARETTVVNPNLRPGTSVRVEYMHNGFDAVVTRTVRAADGTVLHLDKWVSHYKTINGITEVGPSPSPKPKPSASPTPAPSSSPA